MAFVREIVQTNALVTANKLNSELPILQDNLESMKSTVFKYVEDTYIKFLKRPQSVFTTQIQELTNQVDLLKSNINDVVKVDINTTKTEISKAREKLHSIDENLKICYDINHRCEQLMEAQKYINEKMYIKAAIVYKDLKTIDRNKYGNIMLKLKEEAENAESLFIKTPLGKIINDNIKYSIKQDDNIVTHTLKFEVKNDDMGEAIKAYSIIRNGIQDIFDYFCKMIEKMFSDIVEFSSELGMNENECVLKVTNQGKQVKDHYDIVIQKLLQFSYFIQSNFNYYIDEKSTLMNYLRDCIKDKLTKIIIDHCLQDTIPSTTEGLDNYTEVQKHTEALQSNLIQIGLLDAGDTRLIDFTADIKQHFVNKQCKQYKIQANNIMKNDLHNTTIVGKPYDPNDLSFDGFPQCSISKSVLDLLDLIMKIIQKAIACANEFSGYYVSTITDILTMYKEQEHHKRLLMTIPQQMAIFYNNCMYISHELNEHKWVELISQLPQQLNEITTFNDVLKNFNDTAVEMMETLTTEQIDHIEQRIDSSGIHTACDKLDPAVEKAVRQCLRQQELLKTVWQKVLNYYDYNKEMGILLDALCKSLIMNIMSIQDIPTDVGDQLGEILKLVLVRGPKLFTDPKEIHMYAIRWDKLNELIFVLNSNLNSISERWADGKGPLALHFTVVEMRALIRALFQNSDERAHLLAKIN